MKDVKAMIVIDSRINDDVFHQEYEGFYRTAQETSFGGKEEKTHMAVYTDYTGNAVTKNGLQFTGEKLLLHRTGAIHGDLLLDPLEDTIFRYSAGMVEEQFRIQTSRYKVLCEDDKQIRIEADYLMQGEHETEKSAHSITIRIIKKDVEKE
ncbi:MAG: DUF1934 family protein [Blautia sp.]|nr:DUF1934 family protein [Blautia sp.]